MPTVTLLLRTLNPGEHLPPLLSMLERQTRRADEILVVDSGSTDGSQDLVRRAGGRLISMEPATFTHARSTNLGFREARGQVVVMLSQDAIPEGVHWLERLLEPLDVKTGASFGRQVPRAGCFPLERWELDRCYPSSGPPGVLYSNVNSAAQRRWWEEVPFDESLLIAEDAAWARAIQGLGSRVAYVPGASVVHSHAYTLRQVYARCRMEARTRLAVEGHREGWGLLLKGWPKQTIRDLARLCSEGKFPSWPHAALYRFAQFAGIVSGGRA